MALCVCLFQLMQAGVWSLRLYWVWNVAVYLQLTVNQQQKKVQIRPILCLSSILCGADSTEPSNKYAYTCELFLAQRKSVIVPFSSSYCVDKDVLKALLHACAVCHNIQHLRQVSWALGEQALTQHHLIAFLASFSYVFTSCPVPLDNLSYLVLIGCSLNEPSCLFQCEAGVFCKELLSKMPQFRFYSFLVLLFGGE